MLFKQQDQWARGEKAAANLLRISKLAGFSESDFRGCLTNQKLLDQVMESRRQAEQVLGVSGTPTFFINGDRYNGTVSTDAMSKQIEGLLAGH